MKNQVIKRRLLISQIFRAINCSLGFQILSIESRKNRIRFRLSSNLFIKKIHMWQARCEAAKLNFAAVALTTAVKVKVFFIFI
jgi:hypothetical protein